MDHIPTHFCQFCLSGSFMLDMNSQVSAEDQRAEEHGDSESTHRKGEKIQESIDLEQKAPLVLPGWGWRDKDKAVLSKAEFPLKDRIPEPFQLEDHLLITIT